MCEEKCTGARLLSSGMLDASAPNQIKDTICARKRKFSIMVKAIKNGLMDQELVNR